MKISIISILLLQMISAFAFAKSSKNSCADQMIKTLGKRIPDNTSDLLKKYIEEASKDFWEDHYDEAWFVSYEWRKTLKRRLTNRLARINDNPLPAYYIDHDNESYLRMNLVAELFITEGKVQENLKKSEFSFHKQAYEQAVNWYKNYKLFPIKAHELLEHITSLEQAVVAVKKRLSTAISKRSDDWNIEYIEKGKRVLINQEYFDDEMLSNHLHEMQIKLNAANKELEKLQNYQSLLRTRLAYLYKRLSHAVLERKMNGSDNSKLLDVSLRGLKRVLKDKSIRPDKSYDNRLAWSELRAELKDLVKTIKEHEAFRKGKHFYDSLTPERLKALHLSDAHGRSGEVIAYLKKNKYYLTASGLFSAGLGYLSIETILDFILSDQEKRLRCVDKRKTDEQFLSCFENFLQEKYLVQNPLTYILEGDKGLKDKLNNDEAAIASFKAEYRIFLELRVNEMAHKDAKEKFRKEYLELIKQKTYEVIEAKSHNFFAY